MIGIFRNDTDDWALATFTTEVLPGQIVFLPDGRAAMNASMNSIKANTPSQYRTFGIIELTTDGTIAFNDGDDVFIDTGTDTLAAAGSLVGKARRGGVAVGDTQLYVALNASV